tara:strand:- start:442 stop:693 length:252 start_codon:yes stop_codon:yes gene_type:complete
MEEKLYSDLTEKEKAEIISNNRVKEIKNAPVDMQCGNYNENFEPNTFCKRSIKKGSVIYVSSFVAIDCCSIACCDDIFRSSMD